MRKFQILAILSLSFLLFSCNNKEKTDANTSIASSSTEKAAYNFGIVIHGGAGTILKKNMTTLKNR